MFVSRGIEECDGIGGTEEVLTLCCGEVEEEGDFGCGWSEGAV